MTLWTGKSTLSALRKVMSEDGRSNGCPSAVVGRDVVVSILLILMFLWRYTLNEDWILLHPDLLSCGTYRSTRLIETREPRPFPGLAASLPRSTSNSANMRQEVTLSCEFSNETDL